MNIAILLAGGQGKRMGYNIPKQFIEIKQRPVISYTLEEFQKSKNIDKIYIVSIEEYFNDIKKIVKDYNITKFSSVIKNGDTRQKSVFNALEEISKTSSKDDIILIHDSVRAMIKKEDIDLCVENTKKYNCITLAKKVSDTIAKSNENQDIQNFLDRSSLYNIETPQCFKFGIIYESHLKAKKDKKDYTDDTQVVMANGHKVKLIENENINIKLTTKKDLFIFQYYLEN